MNLFFYYLENGHGDVVNLYKQDQSLLNTYDYDIWGNPTVTEEADQYGNPFRYAGEYWDEGTGLQNLRARWYDPSIGRFITEDTWEGRVNHPDSQNPYIYVINNPLIYVDPSGHLVDTLLDIGSAIYDAYEFVKDPSWSNAGYLALDAVSAAVPFVPSGSSAIRATSKADDVSDAVSSVAKGASKSLLPSEGSVGTYKQLVKQGTAFDNITPHHMPSAEKMKKAGVGRNDGISMNMEQPHPGTGGRHIDTYTYGLYGQQLDEYLNLSYRDALANDIMDARNNLKDGLYTPEIRKGLQNTIQMNKDYYPKSFGK